ncbi:MAG: hypothetical protein K5752_04295 [Succinivibrionaceae bacterium]|nr:hypothetical protein [Succinivibrionaceae bacterium]
MNYFPNTLPMFLQSGYTLKRSPSVLRTTMTNGTVRQRLLNKNAPHTLSVTLQFNNLTDYQSFISFYENQINYGADWFIAPILNDRSDVAESEIIARKVRIQNGSLSEQLQFRNHIGACYKISMTLDVDNVEFDQTWSNYYE